MELSTSQISLILAGCVLLIGAVVILWRRGMAAQKTEVAAPAPAPTNVTPAQGEAAK